MRCGTEYDLKPHIYKLRILWSVPKEPKSLMDDSEITSYLGLLHIAPVIFEDIAERVAANRETESSIGRGE